MIVLKLLFTVFLSYILVKSMIRFAYNLNFLDIPNERSYHVDATPRAGGIGFVLSFFMSILLFNFSLFLENWYLFVSVFIVFLVGVVDDKYEVSAKLKFIVIFFAVFLLWFYGLSIDTIGYWFGQQINLVWWIALPFSMFALAGFTNALNLVDGLDGLASCISVVIIIFFGLIGLDHQDALMIDISLYTIASLVGFLFLNWNPAKIFMGDSGSLTLGFIISVLAVLSLKYIHPVFILYLAALPILDTLIVMLRRIRRGKSPFSPDKTHIHHILVKFFENDIKRTVAFLVVLQTIFSSIGYMLLEIEISKRGSVIPFFALFIFVMMFLLFYMIFTGMKKRQKLLDIR